MDAPATQMMTADSFLAWSIDLPKGRRYELMDGEVYEMAPERFAHARVEGRAFLLLNQAAAAAGLVCDVFTDGMAVRIDAKTVFEPDAALRTGAPLNDDETSYGDPVIVVEVLSGSTQALDATTKLAGYFRLATLRHDLMLAPATRTVTHHARMEDGSVRTGLLSSGPLRLDPPGLTLDVASLFS